MLHWLNEVKKLAFAKQFLAQGRASLGDWHKRALAAVAAVAGYCSVGSGVCGVDGLGDLPVQVMSCKT